MTYSKTKVCCVSDLHGNLPYIPDCDILCIAGDIVPLWSQNNIDLGRCWLDTNFKTWINNLFNRGIVVVGVAGNHDFVFERGYHPKVLLWKYLQDSGFEWRGLNIWGTPWQPWYGGWAFNAKEEQLEEKWELIPNKTDILIVHGPPYSQGDRVPYSENIDHHVGSPSLLRRIQSVQPKLVVCGHIHSGYGRYHLGGTIIANAALVNCDYFPVNEPILVEI